MRRGRVYVLHEAVDFEKYREWSEDAGRKTLDLRRFTDTLALNAYEYGPGAGNTRMALVMP